MLYVKLTLLAMLVFATFSSCGRSTPTVTSFTVKPTHFCRPQTVRLDWVATGLTFRLDPVPPPQDVASTGTRTVPIDGTTTFTLTARNGANSATQSVTATRMTADEAVGIGCTSPSCSDGQLVCSTEIPESQYAGDVVVKGVVNRNAEPLTVQGAGRRATIPPFGSTEIFNGARVAGVWTVSLTPSPRCTPTSGTGRGVGAFVMAGCDAR